MLDYTKHQNQTEENMFAKIILTGLLLLLIVGLGYIMMSDVNITQTPTIEVLSPTDLQAAPNP